MCFSLCTHRKNSFTSPMMYLSSAVPAWQWDCEFDSQFLKIACRCELLMSRRLICVFNSQPVFSIQWELSIFPVHCLLPHPLECSPRCSISSDFHVLVTFLNTFLYAHTTVHVVSTPESLIYLTNFSLFKKEKLPNIWILLRQTHHSFEIINLMLCYRYDTKRYITEILIMSTLKHSANHSAQFLPF